MLPSLTLSETMATLRQELSAPLRTLYDNLVSQLTKTATADGAIKRGDVFPEFALPDANGRFTLLSELLEPGPLVINFYRGQWCPICSAVIEAVSAATPAIGAAGATVRSPRRLRSVSEMVESPVSRYRRDKRARTVE